MRLEIDTDIELAQLTNEDVVAIFNTIDSQRDYLGKWLPFVEFTKQLSDSASFVKSVIDAPEDKFEYVFTIRKQGEFVGLIGFKDTDRGNLKTEIGYWLSEKLQKQGIVTKSVARLCDFAFQEMGMNRVQIKCAIGNTSSINVPKRLGFQFEGIERQGELLTGNIFTDLMIFSKLKSDR
ncbi:MAG: GNAT family protein [Paludibacter sp.]|nr:GNAT family protein [Paludibacter sp.]